MKPLIYFFFSALLGSCAIAQDSTAPQWNVTIKVVDEDGQPINGAHAAVGYYVSPTGGEDNIDTVAGANISGLTDASGIFTASHENTHSISLGFHARKDGYYPTDVIHEFYKFSDSDPNKWNPHVTLVLKKIRHPIAMYAKRIIGMPPIFGRPLGYDFVVGDWVAPYGKGTNAYIFFTARKIANDTEFLVTFPNPDDGIQEFHVPYPLTQGSALRSPHEAPEDGYESELTRTSKDYNEDRCYFFRVKTASGTGTLYGKIYGDFMNFSYYLNPTANSLNVEFNPSEDLITHFRLHAEQVNSP
jgi:hypothetical protein